MTLEIIISLLSEIISVPEKDLRGKTKLIPEYNIESIDIAKLMIEIEKRFELTIFDEDVHSFQTIDDVVEYVDALLAE
ncbi:MULTISPECIES: acyl carrier protein [Anaerotignum]|uniref:acyl carrier protein n=1 Tax=Anaerotignum TaxID=2039240 RepID=UPI0021092687|nr:MULTISPECIES: phosphopantetheine-binding protein [Anaerotignum]MCQ4937310.1 phosphopantetheine-binding protein [Anaerotignum propionicum]